jgi:hypothetical protein
LNLEAGILHCLYYLLSRELVRGDSEDFIRISCVNLPVAGAGFLVEGGRNGFDAAAAVDVGFELKRFHDEGKLKTLSGPVHIQHAKLRPMWRARGIELRRGLA